VKHNCTSTNAGVRPSPADCIAEAAAHRNPDTEALEQPRHPFAEDPPRYETRDAGWVRPELVGEVAYGEWTGDGRIRHPSWRGWRPDKNPAEIKAAELHPMQHEDGS
jgi:ATP-dependent DNA ligase